MNINTIQNLFTNTNKIVNKNNNLSNPIRYNLKVLDRDEVTFGQKTESDNMSLHNAITVEEARLLIKKGADVRAKDENGRTLLHKTENPEIAKLLIEHGADVNAKDKYGWTPLHRTMYPEIAKLLIANGADINARDENGNTPLHTTFIPEIARLLAACGADINAKNKRGETPLTLALETGCTQSIFQGHWYSQLVYNKMLIIRHCHNI